MKKIYRHFSIFVLIIAIVLVASGCGRKNEPVVENGRNNEIVENEESPLPPLQKGEERGETATSTDENIFPWNYEYDNEQYVGTTTDEEIIEIRRAVSTPEKTDCEDINDTACWPTYWNRTYGFKFKFPPSWKLVNNNTYGYIDSMSGLSNEWYIKFDTGIDREERDVFVHLFVEDSKSAFNYESCKKENYCYHNEILYPNNNRTIYGSKNGGGWIIESSTNNTYIEIDQILDLDEGAGYYDYIGSETRNNLYKIFSDQVLPTIEFFK